MLARIVSAGDMGESISRVQISRIGEHLAGRIGLWQRSSDVAHAPGSAQVQAVQVNDLWVRPVGDRGGSQQRLWLALRDARQESMEPARKVTRSEHAPHQISLDQTRREKVLA